MPKAKREEPDLKAVLDPEIEKDGVVTMDDGPANDYVDAMFPPSIDPAGDR